ncbi:hypothetical protein BDA99DRAFT_556412 [Phascolomyces articulosus]|uniref:J domain-containing protein n=1 Tax=Phascolomyces articulosus TaxID=60185 RepID=A0AAD5KJG1_9FUNG|nr:hypothetical protein BDA99DRAFT_556412 [Phascolomyces articulosus]
MEKYIEDILITPTDYYRVLGVSNDSSIQDIRRAYLKKSRFCHPDKFVPANSRATECFQSYNTLTDENLRFKYDCARNNPSEEYNEYSNDSSFEYKGDMFERMASQACEEMMEGQFHTLRVLFYTFRGTEHCTRFDDHIIDSIEFLLKNTYSIIMHTQNCYHTIKTDIIELCQLQKKLRGLSFFDVSGRLRLSLTISKIMLKLMLKSTTLTTTTIQKHNSSNHHQPPPSYLRDDHPGFEKTLRRFIEMIESIECKF